MYNRFGNIRFHDADHYNQARALSNRDIIVIGGSAGASVPLKAVLSGLPADVPAAVFVVLHIAARGVGILATVAGASGERIGAGSLIDIASPAPLTCPSCGGELSELKARQPLRFRCQVGHAFTADALASQQDGRIDEALRIIEERADLVHRMAEDGRHSGRLAIARTYDAKAAEYREYADTIRRAMLKSFDPKPR